VNRKGNIMSDQTKESSHDDEDDDDNSGSEDSPLPPPDPRAGVEKTLATYDRG